MGGSSTFKLKNCVERNRQNRKSRSIPVALPARLAATATAAGQPAPVQPARTNADVRSLIIMLIMLIHHRPLRSMSDRMP